MKQTSAKQPVIYPAPNSDNYSPGAGWTLVWSDEFAGSALDSDKWNNQVMVKPFNNEWQDYHGDPDNAYIDNGYLVIKAIHQGKQHKPRQYTSARLNTAQKATWQYGKFVARIQLPHGPGVWPAFWLLGANIDENGGDVPWPASGEIDIMELYGSRDDSLVEVNMHYDDRGHKSMGAAPYRLEQGIFAEQFHTFELEWNARELIWRVDGNEVTRTAIDKPEMRAFHQPYFILLNLAIGGAWSGKPDPTTAFPALMYVDWVRVYQQQAETAPE
ncbi:MAG: glycoside hydrolase family 16 protein [Gammaproteobacteria bacterium]|nr:glycoside hydrolase family 16 protein [Gammaproteobacteria bacterium]